MLKIIQRISFFFTYIFLSALHAAGINSAIQDTEETIISNCRLAKNFESKQENVSSLMGNISNCRSQFVSPVINWDMQTPSEILSSLFWIHDRKVRYRVGTSYVTSYKRGTVFNTGVDSDACPTQIRVEGKTYKLSLNYNGSSYTQQPGNYYLMQIAPVKGAISYDERISLDQFNSKEYQLHILCEIIRRKAIDPHRNFLKDEFSDLPVATGVVMALKLIQNSGSQDIMNSFWQKSGRYHIFSGLKEMRQDGFSKILNDYCERFGIDMNDHMSLKYSIQADAEEIFGYRDYTSELSVLFGNM